MSRSQPAEQAPAITAGALPGPLVELLGAVVEALDVPIADRPADDKQRAELLTVRAADTRVILELLLAHGDIAHSAMRLREWTAEHPVTYPTWQARTEQAADEEEQLLDGPEVGLPGKTDLQPEQRCPAAHPEDPTSCVGPVAVTVLDATNAGLNGCEHHGARLLASLDGGRVYALPDASEGAAIRVFKAADAIRPFPWMDAPRTRPEQLSRAEARREGGEPR